LVGGWLVGWLVLGASLLGCWLLALSGFVGCWLLVVGCWLLVDLIVGSRWVVGWW
jgi:hypothetical protein